MTLGTVVVGAGQSGLNVAIRLRALGYDKPITLIGEEGRRISTRTSAST